VFSDEGRRQVGCITLESTTSIISKMIKRILTRGRGVRSWGYSSPSFIGNELGIVGIVTVGVGD